ncbi:fumarylacetoacetate hydrolase family protein [Zavarzinia sp. CC-PAN008]|uniref:fumarylacetoacetate hydrolase family protein n=1 Tax=Zavarzinia sp. CC-PAN008 TaxID=3243332 RepID=UPI003F744116
MRLASLNQGRDGRLVLVDAARATMVRARAATTLQAALDDWDRLAPLLGAEQALLDAGRAEGAEPFRAQDCAAPLPRAYQWADGSAYVTHVELVRRARGAEMPPSFWTDPLMYQGGSDGFLAPCADIPAGDPAWGLDFEAEVAVITGDVPLGATVAQAAAAIRLVMLVNDVSLRDLIPHELAKGFGFFQSKPASAAAPIALTPDELGPAWDGERLHGPVLSSLNGHLFGRPDAGVDMVFSFPQLIAHAARTRALCTGSIVGSGTVANRHGDPAVSGIEAGGVGSSCIAERRMLEVLAHGAPRTPFLGAGDHVRIEMLDARGRSLFGAIDQCVRASAATDTQYRVQGRTA